ncbi:MAG: NAD-dependent epimerase/dehydratase family protein [Vicingaceae bacterium]
MKKTNILVTGGAGFIGSATALKLSENSSNLVVVIDNLLTGHVDNLAAGKTRKNLVFIKEDVNNVKEVSDIFARYSFDYVFHYAAIVGVQRTLANPILVLNDISGLKNIMSLSKNTGVKRIFFSSSSEVYGEPVELPQNEHTTPLNSRLPYAIVKNVGEAYLKSYKKEFGMDYTIFRFFNTYGPAQSREFVISKFISRALRHEDITIYGDGRQTRTFCFIEDNVEACLNAFEKNMFINDVVNIGSAEEISILDLARKVVALTGSKSEIIFLPPLDEGDMSRRNPDNNKMLKLLNRELVDLDEGIQRILEKSFYLLAQK